MTRTDKHGDHAPKTASYSIVKRGERVYAATPFSRTFVAEGKRLAGARWHAADKEWSWPAYQLDAVTALCADVFGGSSNAPSPNVTTSATAPTIGANGDRMYGMSVDNVRQIFEGFPGRQAPVDKAVMVMGVLSDAQEAMMSGDVEGARQMINRAKWGLARYFVVGGPGGNWQAAPAPLPGVFPEPNKRQSIAVVSDELIEVEREAHLVNSQATFDQLHPNATDDEIRGEMDRGSEPPDFDPEMGF